MDLEYLQQMKSLEETCSKGPNSASRTKREISHVVPISGLVFTRLLTIQNENKTVIELWKNRENTVDFSSSQPHTQSCIYETSANKLNAVAIEEATRVSQ